VKLYRYRAIDGAGELQSGAIRALDRRAFKHQLASMGLRPLPYQWLQRWFLQGALLQRKSEWDGQSASLFILHLSQLLAVSVPLLDALDELIALESNRHVRQALSDMRDDVSKGASLSCSMQRCAGLFSPSCIAVVHSGEASGEIAKALADVSKELSWQADMAERIKTVLLYPALTTLAIVAVFLFLLLYMVPAMMPFLIQQAGTLPTHTRLLLGLSEGVQSSGLLFITGVSLVCLMLWLLQLFNSRLQQFMLHTWLKTWAGQIVLHLSVARYARTLGLLLESGITLNKALEVAEKTLINAALARQLAFARTSVLGGMGLAQSMHSQSLLPPLFVRLVAAGESTGLLASAVQQASVQLQATARHKLERMEKLLGPAVLFLLGGALCWIVVAVLGPIYNGIANQGLLF